MGITFDAAGNRDRPKVDGLTAADPTDPRHLDSAKLRNQSLEAFLEDMLWNQGIVGMA